MNILGDIAGWFGSLIDNVSSISLWYLLLGCAFQCGQTLFNSVAWRGVLQAAYPDKHIRQSEISAGYAGGVALNSVLPGQAGTVTYLALFRASIPGSSVATITAGAAVQAIFWSLVGGLVYLVLLLERPESFTVEIGAVADWIGAHWVMSLLIATAVVALVVVAVRVIRERLHRQWDQMGQGAAILRTPRRYLSRVVTFQALSYACRLGVNSTFLLAYDIPWSLRNLFIVISASSLAAVVSVAPGGIGATTAVLLVALGGQASEAAITSYSVGQQAATMLANIALGLVLMSTVFGWDATRSVLKRRKHKDAETAEASADILAEQLAEQRARRTVGDATEKG
ncbi:MAG: glycosyltransferase AglD [Gaiellales bacterium]|nr:glycosyltransferase AglD [Gaiellales bacterium]